MSELFTIMRDVISPIFIVAGISILISKRFRPSPEALSVFVVYLFIPALAFRGIATSSLDGEQIWGMAGVAIGFAIIITLIGLVIIRPFNVSPKTQGAFILSITLVNAANYGIPLNKFAFGDEGEQNAIIYYVMSVLIGSVIGVYFASRGNASARHAIMDVFKVPIVYAAMLGVIVNLAEIDIAVPIQRSVDISADAAIPGMLALLGLQLANTNIKSLEGQWRLIFLATGVRLILAPLIALPLALGLGLTGITYKVAIVESSMPTAVLANALATEFKSDAEFTSTVTLISTLASIITLSVLLAILM